MPRFVPRERKHKKLARQKDAPRKDVSQDSNSLELRPEEKEASRPRLIRTIGESGSGMSSKKRKRLDKYIENKLRKEETLAIIKRLGEQQSQNSGNASLLQSAKTLGRNGETRRETLKRALAEKAGGMRVEEADQILFRSPPVSPSVSQESEDDEDVAIKNDSEFITANGQQPPIQPENSFGAGLKRPLKFDEQGQPVIQTRKRKKTGPTSFAVLSQPAEHLEWTGLSDGSEESEIQAGSSDEDLSDIDGEDDEDGKEISDAVSASGESAVAEESDMSQDPGVDRKARTSAFKAWAQQQRNEVLGFVPSSNLDSATLALPVISQNVRESFQPRPAEQDPLPESLLQTSILGKERRAYAVAVARTEEMQSARLALPVLAEEQRIMEAVFNNDVVIISGATGSGKTTQIPQFLFEYGFGDANGATSGMIGVTQPRRVAAVSMAKRVSQELGDKGKAVAHQIRFDTTVGRSSAIKFMTDGVLLREMSEDFSLRRYSAVIIDEAHERTVNTDILIALMSRCVKIRRQLAGEQPKEYYPLKLIIMSATLRVEDFRGNSRLFSEPPPLIEAEGRQFDVKVHWSRRTSHDYVEEAFKKITRGHKQLPHGAMLVFLTGQNEIKMLMKRLVDAVPSTGASSLNPPRVRVSASEQSLEAEDLEEMGGVVDQDQIDVIDDDEDDAKPEDPNAEFIIDGEEPASDIPKVHILPLYSQLPSQEQLKVFAPPPQGSRLVVLATNVAETSLTIPGVRYVFDCGRHKERTWDRAGVQTFRTTWISKASADQRTGRAGRTAPGHCYRLYSSAIYESAMPQFAQPEIHRSSLEDLVLQLKSMNIGRVDNFPFPTPPERASLVKAETLLKNLGALDSRGRITTQGREMHRYPLNPRFAQILRLGVTHGCASEVIALVAALDVPELIVPEAMLDLKTPSKTDDEHWTQRDDAAESAREARRKAYSAAQARFSRLDFDKSKITPQADALKVFAAILDHSHTSPTCSGEWCAEHFVREKGVVEATKLREQLCNLVRAVTPSAVPSTFSTRLTTPNPRTIALIKQIVAAGFLDQIALRADLLPTPPLEQRKPKRAIDVRYKTLFSSLDHLSGPERDEADAYVYVHPSSLLARLPVAGMPRYIVYQRLQRGQATPGRAAKIRMHPLTPISAPQLCSIARGTALLELGRPLGRIEVLPASEAGQERREVEVMASLVGDEKGGVGWPLKRQRVIQKRVMGAGWIVEQWID